MKKFQTISSLLIIASLLLINNYACSEKADSIKLVIKNAKNDTTLISAYYSLGKELSLYEMDSAILCYTKGLEICRKIKDRPETRMTVLRLEGNLFRDLGNAYIQHGDYDKALEFENTALKLLNACSDKAGMKFCYKSIGAIRFYQGDAVKSIAAFQSAMKIDESTGDRESYSDCLNNIGMVHYQQDNNDIALENFKKSLEIRKEMGLKAKIAESYNNIGMIYSDWHDTVALEYFFRSLEIFGELGNEVPAGRIYNNIGIVYKEAGDIENASKYFLLSYENRKKLMDKQGIALVLSNLANIEILKKNYKKAVTIADSSLAIALEIGSLQVQSNAYGNLTDAYEGLGNYKKALEYHRLLKVTSDSLNTVMKFETISEMEAKYENEKKQLLIDNLNKENALKASELAKSEEKRNKQLVIIYSFVGGFLIILVFSIIILRLFMQKKKANLLLAEQKSQIEFQNQNLLSANEEISAQRDEIEAQRDEITAQRDLVVVQKEHITEQKKKIEDSIRYAKRIQNAVLPSDVQIENLLGEHFVIFRPKDVVSGDFYWAVHVNEWLIITVADCTGHGVPGAFMSMLGVSFLNEIVRKKEVTKASEVLELLRVSIIEALKQKGETQEQKDGMDIALCAINTKTKTLQFAGANNPLYLVHSHQSAVGSRQLTVGSQQSVVSRDDDRRLQTADCRLQTGDCGLQTDDCGLTENEANSQKPIVNSQLIEVKGDKMPVGIHSIMKPFTNQEIQLEKGDCIYLMSDGFEDQFGGPKFRKFMSKNLKDMIFSIHTRPMAEQKELLEKTFDEWKDGNEQIDDVTILGLRI